MATAGKEAANAPDARTLAITRLKGVGPQLAEKLEKLGVRTLQDLLFHLPARYEDRTRIVPIGSLVPGQAAVIEGEIEHSEIAFRGRRTWLLRIADGTGSLTLRFFYFSNTQSKSAQRGQRVRAFGEVRRGKHTLEIIHPEYRVQRENDGGVVEESLTPVYPLTDGVTQGRLRALTTQALNMLKRGKLQIAELLDPALLPEAKHPSLLDALFYVHRPPPEADLHALHEGEHPAQRRLAFEELLAHHLSLRQLRRDAHQVSALPLQGGGELQRRFLDALPFSLTGAQSRVVDEVSADLAKPVPMMRLVQGDVGSGKTVVAALAALSAVESGRQAAIMAPTELLAEQHFRNFLDWLEPLDVRVAWLSGKLNASQRREQLELVSSGEAGVVVGTHALFQEGVDFHSLALVIIDEQHRFGVHQRLSLREKGASGSDAPHQLIMTATPIPRTLAMTAYADLDTSVIDELPPGRTPVQTVVINESRRSEVVARVNAAIDDGRQVYWVCPLVEESEVMQYEAAEDTHVALSEALQERRVGLVHGRMKPAEKERVMQEFKAGRIDLLVATTVIEVGVDVPNASLMVIENAERMGLAQLHQLRGRVGRGDVASTCVLMYKPPLSQMAKQRLGVMRETTDGFRIAQEDLKIRGPGEVLGTKQTGLATMQVADLVRDADLLPWVQKVAEELLDQQPDIAANLVQRWLADAARYAHA
ncbi:MAG: ATP-dependent DNA helicase RecG [Gammaproteobacteria bacterium]|nr:ATP-dependent DNA helicase RecG [Gammaproteobacteria bacterium]